MSYTQLTQEQRYQIYALLKMGHKRTEIAKMIGVNKSTISRELDRNRGQRGYRPKQAHEIALSRQKMKSKQQIISETWALIEEKLRLDWSPEQILGWLKKNTKSSVSHESIYQYVYADKRVGGNLYQHLRCQKKRRKRYGSYDCRGKIPNKKGIDERPAVVDRRERLGDWEADTIIGKGHCGTVVTLTDRKSRYTLLGQVDHKRSGLVADTAIALLQAVPHWETATSDNGKVFAEHERIANSLGIDVYFSHPYASWGHGTNENTNGLIRQYLPKDRDLTTVTVQESLLIMNRLNHRPRKCLDFKTPNEVFFDQHSVVLDS